MKTNETFYIDLITSYFNGEASEEDILFLETWLKTDPENAKIFKEYSKTWSLLQREKIENSTNIDAEWLKLKAMLHQPSSDIQHLPSVIRHLPSTLRIAALILLFAIPSYFAYRYFAPAPTVQMTAENTVREIFLPDGTAVTLNAGSTLEYPEKFKGKTRAVKLTGEAFFSVTHDEDHPFIVSGGEVRVRVLGTEFNVNTKALNGKMEVVLADGKVSVYFKEQTADPVILIPGEKAEIPADLSGISKSVNDDPNFMAWKTRHFVFANLPLRQVITLLSNAYHTPIALKEEKLNNCRITATFDKQSLESVLNVLKATLDLQISKNGNEFELSGNGCN